MDTDQTLSFMCAVIGLLCIPFALRARRWWLATAWLFGLATSVLFALEVSFDVIGVLRVPFFAVLAIHTLIVTEERSRSRRSS